MKNTLVCQRNFDHKTGGVSLLIIILYLKSVCPLRSMIKRESNGFVVYGGLIRHCIPV
jgi:hypothetical protein